MPRTATGLISTLRIEKEGSRGQHNGRGLCVGVLLLACVLAAPAAAEQLVLTGPTDSTDTMIRASSPDTNFDFALSQVIIQRNQDKFLTQFDLSALPAGATINSATLELTINQFWSGGPVKVRRVTESWSELFATWNSRDGTNNWSTAGGTSDSTNAAQLNIQATGRVSFNVAAIVQEWADGTANNGFLVDIQDATSWAQLACRESEYWTSADRPTLTIDYTPPVANPTVSLSGPTDSADTMIRESAPETNFDFTFTRAYIQRGSDKFLLRFDLSSIPNNAILDEATLHLTVDEVWTGGDLNIRQALSPWVEAEATWDDKSTASSWGSPGMRAGVDYHGTPAATLNVTVAGAIAIPLKDLVQKWVSGEEANEGLMLDAGEFGTAWHQFAVRESEFSVVADRPRLDVTFTLGPPLATKDVAITTAASSITSPAQVEGTVGFAAQTLQVEVNGGTAFNAVRLSPTSWLADDASASGAPLGITLSPTATTTVRVLTEEDEDTVALSWTVTDLTGQGSASDSVLIRKGDSLLLTATGAGTSLTIDADGDATTDHTGAPGDEFPTLYNAAGTFIAEAKIDDVTVGSLTVTVVDVSFSVVVASQIAFTRDVDVVVTPVDARSGLDFEGADPDFLNATVAGLTATGVTLDVTPLRDGEPTIVARLSPDGPVVATRIVDEFVFENIAAFIQPTLSIGTEGANRGFSTLRIRPFVQDLEVVITENAVGVTFDNGTATLQVNTDDFQLEPDGSATLVYFLNLAPGINQICMDIDVIQESSPGVTCGGRKSDNGDVLPCTCTMTVRARPKFLAVDPNPTADIPGLINEALIDALGFLCDPCLDAEHGPKPRFFWSTTDPIRKVTTTANGVIVVGKAVGAGAVITEFGGEGCEWLFAESNRFCETTARSVRVVAQKHGAIANFEKELKELFDSAVADGEEKGGIILEDPVTGEQEFIELPNRSDLDKSKNYELSSDDLPLRDPVIDPNTAIADVHTHQRTDDAQDGPSRFDIMGSHGTGRPSYVLEGNASGATNPVNGGTGVYFYDPGANNAADDPADTDPANPPSWTQPIPGLDGTYFE